MLNFHNFTVPKILEVIRISPKNHFFPTGNSKKKHLAQRATSRKNKSKCSQFDSKVSGKSHSDRKTFGY